MTTTQPLARLDRVTRRFGAVTALDDVTLDIAPGSIVGLLGPNGAGKTTMLSLLQGLRRPQSGTVSLFGGSPCDPKNRGMLGVTPQQTSFPETLRAGEVIDYVGGHFARRIPTARLADEFGLEGLLRRQCGALSGGQRRRLAVALAFVGDPRLVLLDEPTTGLDVDGRHVLWEVIRRAQASGVTVVVTSHYLEEIEALAERVVVIAAGRVVADDTLDRVVGLVGVSRVRVRTDAAEALSGIAGVVDATADADAALFTVRDADAFVRELVRIDPGFRDLTVRGASLEEAFRHLTETDPDALAETERKAS